MSGAGLHVERTRLAWRRTAAAYALAALVVGRILAFDLGHVALAVAIPFAAVALLVVIGPLPGRASAARDVHRAPGDPSAGDAPPTAPAPALLALVAAVTALAGLTGAVTVLLA
ncbi:DUF202 domain-containing protein [Micromonospora sp. NPDC000207]|uniref:DUF202 domain-containing protein n=1 Tax=Micromonospora sp. NPDC000207 TaxID=3154246 RepID=UPI0033306779